MIGMRSQKVNSVCRFSLLVSLLLATWPSQLGIVAIISCVGSINSQSSHLAESLKKYTEITFLILSVLGCNPKVER